jgi:hypothetical protein
LKQYLRLLFLIPILSLCKNKASNPIGLIEIKQFASGYSSGSDTLGVQQFDDVWIITPNEDLGVYELPAKIPMKALSDSIDLFITPGYKYENFSEIRVKYQLIKPYIKKVKLEAGKSYTLTPTFKYFDNYKIDIENFESGGVKLTKLSFADTNFIVGNDPTYMLNNSKYGQIVLTNTKKKMGLKTTNKYALPLGNSADKAFLEFSYKSDVAIVVGLHDGNQSYAAIVEKDKSATWTKAYLDLAPSSKSANYTQGSYVYFTATNKDGLPTANIFIDEIKVIYKK